MANGDLFAGGPAEDDFIPHDLDLEQRSVLEAEVLVWRLRSARQGDIQTTAF